MDSNQYKQKIFDALDKKQIQWQALVLLWEAIGPFVTAIAAVSSIGFSIYSLATGGAGEDFQSPTFGYADSGPRYSFGALRTTVTNEIPVPIIYGEVKLAGNIIYQSDQETIGSESQMYRCICWGEGEVNSIGTEKINDIAIGDLTGCSSTTYVGTGVQNVDSRFSDSVKGLRYTSYSAQTVTTSEDLRGGNPNHTAMVEGLIIKTWDGSSFTGATFSRNPAACIRDFLTNTRYGLGIPEAAIDDASFGEVYSWCDTVIPESEGAGTETRALLDYVIDSRRPALDILQSILSTFGGYLVMSGSTFKLRVEGTQSVSQAFNMDSILKRTFQYQKASKDEIANRIAVQYIDPDYNYTKVIALAEDKIDQDDRSDRAMGENVVSQEYSMLGVTRFSQASRMANLYLYLGKLCSTFCSFDVSIDALAAEVGDIVTVTHDTPYWTAKPFRILGIQLTEKNTLTLTCKEYNASIYTDNPGSGISVPDYGTPPNPFEAPKDITNIALEEIGWRNEDGTHIANVDITWTQPSETQYVTGYAIQYAQDGGSYEDAGFVSVGDNYFRVQNVDVGSEYTFKILTFNQESLKSSGVTSDLITIVGKDAPPSNVTGFQINQYADNLLFTWNDINDVDRYFYEIRTGASWATGTIAKTFIFGTEYLYSNINIGTFSYWIKAIDRSGNYSATALGASITVATIPNQNIIATQSENPTWSGTHVQTMVSGTSCAIDYGFVSGNYTTDAIDLGSVVQGKLTVNYTASTGGISAFDSEPAAAWDTYSTLSWLGYANPSQDDISFYISTSDDNATYSSYELVQYADYTCRYFKIQSILQRNSIEDTLLLNTLTLNFDVPDVIETGQDLSCPTPTGVYQAFTKTFHKTPSVGVIGYHPSGTFMTPILTNKTKDGFTVMLRDEDAAAISGTCDWKAIGW